MDVDNATAGTHQRHLAALTREFLVNILNNDFRGGDEIMFLLKARSKAALGAALVVAVSIIALTRSTFATNYDTPWTRAQVITIDGLAKKLNSPDKPVVLQIGIESLYKSSHIPGSIFAGPAMDNDGLKKLREAAAKIPRNQTVVIYCGCCPFEKCPNVKPAFSALIQMGFKKLLVLEIPQGFGPDWVSKGLPVEH